MKLWFSILSLCMVAVFVFSSILQFHHHDADGNVSVYALGSSSDISCHNGSKQLHFCHQNHCCGNDSHSDEDCCILKLSTQKTPRPTNIGNVELCFSMLFLGIMHHTIINIFAQKHPTHHVARIMGSLSGLKYTSRRLRAPPACL